jgi:hypothetical protein
MHYSARPNVEIISRRLWRTAALVECKIKRRNIKSDQRIVDWIIPTFVTRPPWGIIVRSSMVFLSPSERDIWPQRLTLNRTKQQQRGRIALMIYAKPHAVASFVAAAVAIGMLGAEKLRAQPVAPSPVDCDRYAQDYARNHSRNGQVIRGAGGGALLGAGIGALAGGAGAGAANRCWGRRSHRGRPARAACIGNLQPRLP